MFRRISASRSGAFLSALSASTSSRTKNCSLSAPSILVSPSLRFQNVRYNTTQQPPQQQAPPTSSSGGISAGDPTPASHVAKRVNRMKRAHQTASAADRKRMELEVWREMNSLSDEQIAAAEGQSVALLLNAWAYFSRFWEKGKDGPSTTEVHTE